MKTACVYSFPNGMVACCDKQTGQQIPEFQGALDEVWPGMIGRLNAAGYRYVELNGNFPPDAPFGGRNLQIGFSTSQQA